ncbi:dihydrodipicolinate synthase family protein [Halorhabdus amylolytica]|uniref:dihydrodipicolinate synthase family protein n=1 Tax=Halorhabdus amylolytica TaxID=2559573 RepID=UPI0010A9AEDB|nr:dihydrodipicolinate synthase family protein [Halorhabdus amylolytica]
MTEIASPGDDDPLSLQGVIPPTLTVFEQNGDVDLERTAEHARFVVEQGVHGVFPLGTTGEFTLLSSEERKRVLAAVVDAVGSDVPVIAGVGESGTSETIARATPAQEAGVDGLVVVTPYYYPVDDEGAIQHYRRIAEETAMPIYVYHIPSKTGNSLSLHAISEIAAIDGIAGLKDSSKDVPWLGQAIADNSQLTFMAGSDSLLVPGLDLGCSGLVSAVANAFPELVVELFEAYESGDRERARTLQSEIYAVRTAIKRGPYLAGVKEALSLRGFDAGPLRDPLRRMSETERRELEDDLQQIDSIESI